MQIRELKEADTLIAALGGIGYRYQALAEGLMYGESGVRLFGHDPSDELPPFAAPPFVADFERGRTQACLGPANTWIGRGSRSLRRAPSKSFSDHQSLYDVGVGIEPEDILEIDIRSCYAGAVAALRRARGALGNVP